MLAAPARNRVVSDQARQPVLILVNPFIIRVSRATLATPAGVAPVPKPLQSRIPMSAHLIDGNALAKQIRAEAAQRAAA
jgi:mRNA-degrading endonuclease toxin of MazEF toxin-antitoxin module